MSEIQNIINITQNPLTSHTSFLGLRGESGSVCVCLPLDDVFLLLDGLPQRVTQGHLSKILQSWVDGVSDGVIEHTLHASHQHLQSLYHCHHLPTAQHSISNRSSRESNKHVTCDEVIIDLHESELLLAGVVVSGGSLVLLSVVRTLFVGVLVGGMNQFPRVLWGKSQSF